MSEKFGLRAEVIAALNAVFRRFPKIEKVLVYGSRAKGNYRAGSDIDLCVKGDGIDLSEILKIESEVDDLLLPYKMDLTLYDGIDNPDLKSHIDRVGMIFYDSMSG